MSASILIAKTCHSFVPRCWLSMQPKLKGARRYVHFNSPRLVTRLHSNELLGSSISVVLSSRLVALAAPTAAPRSRYRAPTRQPIVTSTFPTSTTVLRQRATKLPEALLRPVQLGVVGRILNRRPHPLLSQPRPLSQLRVLRNRRL